MNILSKTLRLNAKTLYNGIVNTEFAKAASILDNMQRSSNQNN